MVEQIKALAIKSYILSSVPRTNQLERRLLILTCWLTTTCSSWYIYVHTCVHTRTSKYINKSFKIIFKIGEAENGGICL